jgi:hypothetical protein
MEKPTDPSVFDTGRKGFLTYEEYVGYCLSVLRQPLDKRSVGSRIGLGSVRFRRTETNTDGVFDFFSCGSDCITAESLRKATEKLGIEISGEDLTEMVYFFSAKGSISREAFDRIFE